MAEKLTSPSVLRSLLFAGGIHLKPSLGQHFLADENVLLRIVETIDPKPSEIAVEVGAGLGTLTVALAPHVQSLSAVEIDPRLTPILKEQVAPFPNVTVIEADFLCLPLAQFGEGLLIVGNLPYGITSEVLLKLIRERDSVSRAVFLVQEEVGEKLVAPPGPKVTRLGLHLRAYYEVDLARKISRHVFFPPPEVDSALIRLRKLPVPRITASEEGFEGTLALLFSTRRKTLRRVLLGRFPPSQVERILKESGLDPKVRGEALPLEAIDRLALLLSGRRP